MDIESEIPKEIKSLITRYNDFKQVYQKPQYNETQLRREFTDPFFRALGWDIDNNDGLSELYKDVVHEDSIQIRGENTKIADYSFRIGGKRIFIVETKKPSIRIKEDAKSALQLRRYGWNAGIKLGILTNFEEFAVYNFDKKPNQNDKPHVGRDEYLLFSEYSEKWKFISGTFSKNSVLKGYFDEWADRDKGKHGTATVDKEILNDIETWRKNLAQNIAIRNKTLAQDQINYSVQKIIDRILFLRICEDRAIEKFETLKSTIEKEKIYPRICEIFKAADSKYNSGLFHFTEDVECDELPDALSLTITIDDNILKNIIKSLYPPDCPYEFSVIPPAILGQVYEQFIGKVIHLSDGHHVRIEYKPDARKAGGVYYTPQYVVDYIVKNTLSELLEGKTPRDIAKIHILDPSCGSGSFLLGAYQFLLNWHIEWYTKYLAPLKNLNKPISDPDVQVLLPIQIPRKQKKGRVDQLDYPIYKVSEDNSIKQLERRKSVWKLSTIEKKRILRNNIYGVDIDNQAVEVTKLALLLQVLEDENEENISKQLKLYAERALPSLNQNIKCGNSLIGTDVYSNGLLSKEEMVKINAFDWEKEFPDVIKNGGFDVLIGNPPWGASFTELQLKYLREHHSDIIDRMIDSYLYFINQSIRLTKKRNPIGLIVPSTILNQVDATSLRKILLKRGLSNLISLGEGIFTRKVLNTSTIFISNSSKSTENFILSDLSKTSLERKSRELDGIIDKTNWEQWKSLVERDPHYTFFVNKISDTELLDRLRKENICLDKVIDGSIQRGVSPDVKEAHVVSKIEAKDLGLEKDLLRDSISGPQIKKYEPWHSDQCIIYTDKDTPIHNYPKIESYLKRFKHKNTCKEVIQGKHPYYALHRARNPDIFKSPKFIGLTTSKKIELIYDESSSLFVTDAMYVFSVNKDINPWALMAIMHSNTFLVLYRIANQGESRVIPQVKASKLDSIPIPIKILSKSKEICDLEGYCKQILELHRFMNNAKNDQEKIIFERQIDSIQEKINLLTYGLYGLSENEIKIIEDQ
jgi:type I restriction-modification system DNA methylase subunit